MRLAAVIFLSACGWASAQCRILYKTNSQLSADTQNNIHVEQNSTWTNEVLRLEYDRTGDAADLSSSRQSATFSNVTWYSNAGGCVYMTTGQVNVDHAASINLASTTPWTIMGWCYATATNNAAIWTCKHDGGFNGFMARFYPGQFICAYYTGSPNYYTKGLHANISWAVNSWHHFAFVQDASNNPANWIIYYDGIAQAYANEGTTAAGASNTSLFSIGKRNPDAYGPFSGYMDDLRIYNRAVTSNEVWTIYNATKPAHGGNP